MDKLQPKLLALSVALVPFLLGLVFVFSLPLYQGPDEPIHYATLQYRAEPKTKTWPIHEEKIIHSGKDIRELHLSEEAISLGILNQFDTLKWQEMNTQSFHEKLLTHPEELVFEQNTHKQYIDLYPTNTSGTSSWYYTLGHFSERYGSTLPANERFFLARLFSLIIYLATVIVTYLIAKHVLPSRLASTLFTLFVAFQPMLLATGSIVNIDIVLIFSFHLFFLALLWVLKKPRAYSPHISLWLSFILALFSKGPGIVLLLPILCLYLFILHRDGHISHKNLSLLVAGGSAASLLLGYLVLPKRYILSIARLGSDSLFVSPIHSLLAYVDKTITFDALLRNHASYWGNFGWLDTKIHEPVLWLLLTIELLAWLGIILFLLRTRKNYPYLPSKLVIWFSLCMLLALQIGIRFYDWRTFDITKQILIGTPGRYFLPTLTPHLLILLTGLGYLLTNTKSQLITLLKGLTLGMLLLTLYSLLNIIIPRYYL